LKTSRIAYPVREKGAEPPKSKNRLLDVYSCGKFTIILLLSHASTDTCVIYVALILSS